MSQAFFTISTVSHVSKALALLSSVRKFNTELDLYLCITNTDDVQQFTQQELPVKLISLKEILTDQVDHDIASKYDPDSDALRWSSKSVFFKYLLREKNYDKVLYADNDIYFFNAFDLLLNDLDKYGVLLSPHWRISDPEIDPDWFETNFKDGLYNGGFVGASKDGLPAIDWWAKACRHACEIKPEKGLWVDQRYLVLLPAHFENIGIIRHKGCNVAYWNPVECRRTKENDEVLINGKWPIIFIHFTRHLIQEIDKGTEVLLKPYLEEYGEAVSSWSSKFNV